ncbi:low molecular weight phosphotyrosine protein phosphatase-like isoform X2 [Aethina tumida]|uniref:low molecular weight phosphotyrosine protein phosphatase-like isoform X2 n=1 Tax=Aethina tumida TaxID=116153 RepID=UPI002147EE86|nr:low molecular weight phosphotyrosine protein phosphatase-like isoform X2 [Aethina tumida]
MDDKKGALFVCLGNTCRSPIAEGLFRHLVEQRGLTNKWRIDSAGLADWNIGCLPEPRARQVMHKYNIKYDNTARQIEDEDFFEYDYIFGMDENNISNLKGQKPQGSKAEILLLGDFDPTGDRIIRDPYYDNDSKGFEKCYEQCLRACNAFLDKYAA